MRISHAERWGTDRRPGERKNVPSPQLTFDQLVTRGGRRKGAGRKPGKRHKVQHVARPRHSGWMPVHITLRCAPDLPSLRHGAIHDLVKGVIAELRREDFRIVHYS